MSGILRDASAGAVLTLPEHRQALSAWLAASGEQEVACLEAGGDFAGDPDVWFPPQVRDQEVAFLQYTSGSTGTPKGVMVTHANLLPTRKPSSGRSDTQQGVVAGSWLPLYHDMGLIGQSCSRSTLGGHRVLMSPRRLPQAAAALAARRSPLPGDAAAAAPTSPTSCACAGSPTSELAGLDLSRWRVRLQRRRAGARRHAASASPKRFAPDGFRREAFYPCYGLAEGTLLVSGRRHRRQQSHCAWTPTRWSRTSCRRAPSRSGARTLVGCGRPREHEVRIVDPKTREVLPDGRVGEIWLRGRQRRRRLLEPTRRDRARPSRRRTADGRTGFLRTGDLGFLLDGELSSPAGSRTCSSSAAATSTRRTSSMPCRTRTRAPPVAAAPCSPSPDSEAERDHWWWSRRSARAPTTSRTCRDSPRRYGSWSSREFQLPAANVVLVRPGVIRKTTSGKTQRTLDAAALPRRRSARPAPTPGTTGRGPDRRRRRRQPGARLARRPRSLRPPNPQGRGTPCTSPPKPVPRSWTSCCRT